MVVALTAASRGLLSALMSGVLTGVPTVIVVSTDWLREMRVCVAAEWRAGIMEGPGRRWAFVK